MNRSDIFTIIKDRIVASDLELAYTFDNVASVLPETGGVRDNFAEISVVPSRSFKRTLSNGGKAVEIGRVQAVVVTPAQSGEKVGADLADDFGALFPFALRLTMASGVVTMTGHPEIRNGFLDGNEWRTPVSIGYTAVSN